MDVKRADAANIVLPGRGAVQLSVQGEFTRLEKNGDGNFLYEAACTAYLVAEGRGDEPPVADVGRGGHEVALVGAVDPGLDDVLDALLHALNYVSHVTDVEPEERNKSDLLIDMFRGWRVTWRV